MPTNSKLFNSFSNPTKEQWLEKITRDLKGKPLEELEWQLEEHIRVAATHENEDNLSNNTTLNSGRNNNSWSIGEYLFVRDPKEANTQALEGLQGGVNAPLFHLHHLPSREELDVLLADIEPSFISIHFAPAYPGKDPAELFRNLIYYVRRRNLKLADIYGSMDFDPLLDWSEPPFTALARLLKFAQQYTPNFKVLQVNGLTLHTGIENTSRELALLIAKGVSYLNAMEERGIPAAVTNQHLQFSVAISTSYFVEIAKIRALKILWANVLNGFGLANEPISPIAAHLAAETQTDQREYNMIKAATQGMSAIIGGASFLYLPPADLRAQGESSSFTRRIARNVQHLLQMESHLDQVVDPAAGSYYIEHLTQQFCEQAWGKFQQIEAQGGFLQLTNL